MSGVDLGRVDVSHRSNFMRPEVNIPSESAFVITRIGNDHYQVFGKYAH